MFLDKNVPRGTTNLQLKSFSLEFTGIGIKNNTPGRNSPTDL